MKKLLALLMTLVMAVSFVVTLSVSSSAATVEWVEETYNMQNVMDAFGTHEVDDEFNLKAEALFGDGMWTYEWFDVNTGEFSPMSAYYDKAQEGWSNGGWGTSYVPYADAVWDNGDPACYCLISSNGKTMHPGDGAGPVISYIVPVDGVISFDASIYPYGSGNTSDSANGGTSVYVYQNDTRIWPATEDEAKMTYDMYTADAPKEVSVVSFNVKAGDRIRMTVTCSPGTGKGSKGTTVVKLPVVTWHSASVPIGNPNGNPPEGIMSKDATANSCKVVWEAAKNAAGYNIYLDGKKVNDSPVTALEYVIEGLEARTLYEFSITTVTTEGKESEKSEPQSFRTKKAATTDDDTSTSTDTGNNNVDTGEQNVVSSNDITTDPNTDDVTTDSNVSENTESNAGTKTTSNKKNTSTSKKTSSKKTTASDNGFPIWIIIVIAAVVVLAAAAVVVFFVLKKKPAEEAAIEGEVAEEAAEEASEDAPEAPTEE